MSLGVYTRDRLLIASRPAAARAIPDLLATIFSAYCSGIRAPALALRQRADRIRACCQHEGSSKHAAQGGAAELSHAGTVRSATTT